MKKSSFRRKIFQDVRYLKGSGLTFKVRINNNLHYVSY